ncbi:MAG: hypothetical protein A2X28_06705 [Elusimicrobia bacterium GWA2_56_46]|nr:MAG: hypothetical protein A2X28_06705 [Elusimicrobia bacterium GWA2_56_46]OGR54859.1 MAG: hypothetical protein A2X39_11285 [Elusimicrobia bacterium GWC2_56_31]HBB67126.1 hypothetical protein [Elusimicrobiota bacterium]HBW23347.1 hypothetical protein [Elusimicrobiota bacterium]
MKISDFEWDRANEAHIARHNVTPAEAEEVFLSEYFLRKTHSGRYGLYGRSFHGRCLFIVFEKLKGNVARIITARDMADKEKIFYRRVKR